MADDPLQNLPALPAPDVEDVAGEGGTAASGKTRRDGATGAGDAVGKGKKPTAAKPTKIKNLKAGWPSRLTWCRSLGIAHVRHVSGAVA